MFTYWLFPLFSECSLHLIVMVTNLSYNPYYLGICWSYSEMDHLCYLIWKIRLSLPDIHFHEACNLMAWDLGVKEWEIFSEMFTWGNEQITINILIQIILSSFLLIDSWNCWEKEERMIRKWEDSFLVWFLE